MRHITYTLVLAMLVLITACKKDALENNATVNAIPKEGLELLTTDADSTYFIWASKNDTFMYRSSSDGIDYGLKMGYQQNTATGPCARYWTTAACPTGQYKSLSMQLKLPMAQGETIDTSTLEKYLKPGRYNIGEKPGEIYMIMYARSYNIQAWTDVSSTDLPIEIVSVNKIGFKNGRNIYRIRGRVVAKCGFGCPMLWVSMYQGAFQFDVY